MTFAPNDATRAQIDAARPDYSTWLTANAGSGKTRVLTDRVARLLLDGVEPQQILCLTYTKAAASEMQNRLFKRLGEWAMREDDALRDALRSLGIDSELRPDHLRNARTLFARAIETPGGLKIQTIHSFCAAILRRFPLEAQVSPQFTEIEDRAAELLRAEIVDTMAAGPDAHLIENVARFYTGEDFSSLTRGIVGLRDVFLQEIARQDVLALLGQPPNLNEAQILQSVFVGGELELIQELVPHLAAKGGNDGKAADKLASLIALGLDSLALLEGVLLTGPGAKSPFAAKIGSFPTKATQKTVAHLMPELDALMQRVEDAREARLALATVEKTMALHQFARGFLEPYEAQKQARGWLDFDDLILKTRDLLSDRHVAAWVLYRIDGGVDHILVDEAQDTSPQQWDIIEKLTEEFYSGAGTRPQTDRTLFVVGDKKQSIYSFQGADPDEMDRKALTFRDKIAAAGKLFQTRGLEYSFRSASAILRAVDQTFDPRVTKGFDKESTHKAFKTMLPGRVDLWPVVEEAEDEDKREWTDPVDRRSATHHTVILAEKIAAEIQRLTDGTHYIPDGNDTDGTFKRPITPGDFLILVQRRSALFSEIIRACKAAGLPIAGADRLKVGAELAVKDLGALLSFLATPDDNLSLATALKSPLFGWSEQQLFTLAHGRGKSLLWETLRKQDDLHPETLATLNDLRGQVDFLRPYDLIERILTRHQGRARLLARLGPEAEDGINAMLSQALGYERNEIPSLTGFLEWMQTDDLEIKRQIDSSSDQIRVMSVHGAKGLEAPIVILPDTGRRDIRVRDEVVQVDDVPLWKPKSADLPSAMQTRLDQIKDAERRERLRLLYVAMTRAEKWLIVTAAGRLSNDRSDWYQIMETAMGHLGSIDLGDDGSRRYEEGDWDGLPAIAHSKPLAKVHVLEPVFASSPPPERAVLETLSPSDLGGAKALPGEAGEDTETAMAFGSLVHDLLENLPRLTPAAQQKTAAKLSERWPGLYHHKALEEAQAVLNDPQLAAIFAPDTLAEVPVTVPIEQRRLHGTIDRLIISKTHLLAVDFKTNRVVPDTLESCPEGILRQMGAYAHMLSQIYPSHTIETAILWTATRELMVLPHDIVTDALMRSPHLDGAGRAS